MAHDRGILENAVAEAVCGHCCVSALLGYGNVLFLGFGDAPIEPLTPEGRRACPPYELHANMADWRVGGDHITASGDDDRAVAEPAILKLVGRTVVGWRLSDGHALTIEFSGGHCLEVVPLDDADVADSDAWSITLGSGHVVAVSCGGQVATIDDNRPVRDWFTGASSVDRTGR